MFEYVKLTNDVIIPLAYNPDKICFYIRLDVKGQLEYST